MLIPFAIRQMLSKWCCDQCHEANPARQPNLFQLKIIALIAILALSGCGYLQAPSSNPIPTHLQWAELLIKNLLITNTTYRHEQGSVTWKGWNGARLYESYTDCSGFVSALLEQAYGLTPDDFEQFFGTRRPLAITYYDAVTRQNHFKQISSIYDVQASDFIIIKYPPDNDNSGHIMLVADKPNKYPSSKPLINGTEQWIISVVDSSESGHGNTDTRWEGNGIFHDGLGQGVFRIYTNDAGELVGYAWSTFENSEYYGRKERPLVIGRFEINQ
jgi:hypothetical protein